MHALLCLPLLFAADVSPEQLKLLKTFRDEFVQITPGEGQFPAEFTMGRAAGGSDNERPVRTITFQHKFAIAKYEVPQNLWEAVLGTKPSRWQGPRNSVEMLTYDDAVLFCAKATELMRDAKLIGAKQTIRLPSEAEWEYACRAGTKTIYGFGDDEKLLDKYGWYTGNAAGNDPEVGVKAPNAWGLYDTHGYLWEWCADSWHDNYDQAPTDGRAWHDKAAKEPSLRVLRGGSWKDKADRCTSSTRIGAKASTRDDAIGLRCVLE